MTERKIAQRSPQAAETTSTARRNANPAVLALACRNRHKATSAATRTQEEQIANGLSLQELVHSSEL